MERKNLTTTALLAFVCNPYLAVLQKRTYLKYWKDEVDQVLVNVNGINSMIRKFIVDLWQDEKVVVIEEAGRMNQGTAFDGLYPKATGDIIMTLDSDNFIYKKGIVTRFKALIESGEFDAVGSTGQHAKPAELATWIEKKYGTVRLNPFMAFFRKEVIDKIKDVTFTTYGFCPGDYIPLLGTMKEKGWLDVMSYFCIKFGEASDKKPYFFAFDHTVSGEYFHMYGISSIFRRCFHSLEYTNTQKYEETKYTSSLFYMCRYYLLYEATKDEVLFPEYNKEYEKGFLDNLGKTESTMEQLLEVSEDLKKLHTDLFII